MKIKAPAKINLALDILDKDETGYHIIQTVYQEIPLYDEIDIEKTEEKNKINFEGDEAHLINKSENTITSVIKDSCKINIKKNIPLGAGLGGGSSDVAAVLKELYKENLQEKAEKIGCDVPFFIYGGTAYGTHYGEKIETLPPLSENQDWDNIKKVLVIPQIRKNTSHMYSKVDTDLTGKNKEKTKEMIQAIKRNNIEGVLKNIHNDFELFAEAGFSQIKDALLQNGIEHVLLCGSGTAVIGLSNNPFDLEGLSQALPNQRILNLTP